MLAEEAAEGPIPAVAALLVLEPAAVLVEYVGLGVVLGFSSCLLVLVRVVYLLPLHVEIAELEHVVNHLVAHSDSLLSLVQSVLVTMDLGQNGAVLQLELTDDEDLPHPIRDVLLLEVNHVDREVLERVLDALGALFQHLHLLVAERHVVEHDEQVIHVPPALSKVDGVHDPVGLLEQIQGPLILVFLDEGDGTFI